MLHWGRQCLLFSLWLVSAIPCLAQSASYRAIPVSHQMVEPISPYVGHTPPKILPIQAERSIAPAPLPAGNSTLGASPTTPTSFGSASNVSTQSLLSESRQFSGSISNGEMISGREAAFRASSDAGNLLGESPGALGVSTQNRTPIVTDTHVRGSRTGQLLASGSYWVPARIDLDTLLSKMDSRMIESLRVIKGPYDVIYGPGFDFVDVSMLSSPRYGREMEVHGNTATEYKTNGQQLYGRQMILGGDDQWGFRVGYGHRTGNDYETGNGSFLPSSYKSRDIDVALGFDLSQNSTLELHYLRLDQTDVEFPGQIFDLDFLKTDAIDATLSVDNQPWFDQLVFETWYNQTIFRGNAQSPGKRTQIPQLDDVGLFARTEVYSRSSGFQLMGVWGEAKQAQLRAGVDFRFVLQELNEPDGQFQVQLPQGVFFFDDQNGPVPRSYWSNPGLFADVVQPINDQWTVSMGARLDFASTNVVDEVTGNFSSIPLSNAVLLQLLGADTFETEFVLPAGHMTAAYKINETWTLTGAMGTAGRTPNLTELYAFGPFMAILQQGFTSPVGDPNLNAERLWQTDLRLDAQAERFRAGIEAFSGWIHDYITYEAIARNSFDQDNGLTVRWVNTDWALLVGGEAYGEWDANRFLTLTAQMQYVQGQDLTRSDGGASTQNFLQGLPRDFTKSRGFFSGISGSDSEPLPGIPPLESRLGVVFHAPCPNPHWTLEFSSRIVNQQNRVASSLLERPTSGFTTYDLRGSWRPQERLTLLAGVENLTDKYYREHLDLRTGRGVFQPGINFYVGSEWVY